MNYIKISITRYIIHILSLYYSKVFSSQTSQTISEKSFQLKKSGLVVLVWLRVFNLCIQSAICLAYSHQEIACFHTCASCSATRYNTNYNHFGDGITSVFRCLIDSCRNTHCESKTCQSCAVYWGIWFCSIGRVTRLVTHHLACADMRRQLIDCRIDQRLQVVSIQKLRSQWITVSLTAHVNELKVHINRGWLIGNRRSSATDNKTSSIVLERFPSLCKQLFLFLCWLSSINISSMEL